MNTQEKSLNNYLSERLNSSKDDRQSDRKLDNDARLRGSLGEKEANRIIKTIDDIKSRH